MSQDAEIREAFALFDKRGTGAIPRESLGDLLRALGQNPTQAEVAELASQQQRDSELPILTKSAVGESDGIVRAHALRLVYHDCSQSNYTVNYDTFTQILHRPDGFKDAGTEDEFIRGFAVFDKDQTGHIGVGELRYVLTNLGEKLSDQEVDELLAGVKVAGDGSIDYRAFVREIMAA